MRIFGIDPGSIRTGYGCVETDGTRHRLVLCGAIRTPAREALAPRLKRIHEQLLQFIAEAAPDCVVVENLFHAKHARSALILGHARGVAVLAAVQSRLPVLEYTPAEIKMAVVGYGRAEKAQMQQMVKLLLGLDALPSPYDAADALAVAICHAHASGPAVKASGRAPRHLRSWRHARVADLGRRQTP
ncbi:MAG TPA: crossover junction endodeoxyribonuclease RuvC [Vicinamibacterales bacterium]|nr:crossover junction endodeoxyribonuclease RuvC [Vicinamibacterales bacterium]